MDAKEIVDNMCVVNDGAERGVKLCYDYLSLSKNDMKHQQILQVVENNRSQKPNQRLKKEQSKRWFLKFDK